MDPLTDYYADQDEYGSPMRGYYTRDFMGAEVNLNDDGEPTFG